MLRLFFQASIFYQDMKGRIINKVFICDWPSGTFTTNSNTVISDALLTPPPNNNTGLAVVLLGDTDGYRAYFHDGEMHVHQLMYAPALNHGKWVYGGLVSRDPPYANSNVLVAQFRGISDNISVAYPKDDANIEVSRINEDKLWHICKKLPFPFRPHETDNG